MPSSIVKVEVFPLRLPLAFPHHTATGVITESRKVIIKITTEGSVSGYGEASSFPAYGGGTSDEIRNAIMACSPHLAGANPFNHKDIMQTLGKIVPEQKLALAAIDVALHDVMGRSLGKPIFNLYGGKMRETVDIFLIIGGQSPAQIAQNARQAVADNYRVVKVKAGFEPIEQTILKIEAIRQEVGSALDITVDANQTWKVAEAIDNIKRLERFNLQSVEQPVAADDIDGMAAVKKSVSTRIIADESVWGIEDARKIIGSRAADLLSVRISKAGGISDAREILNAAHKAGKPCILGSMLESDLGVSAALQLAASVDCKLYASALSHYTMYNARLLTEPLRQTGSQLHIPPGPGLGFIVSEQALMQYMEL